MSKIRKFSASKIEWRYIYQLLEAIPDKSIRNYVTNQILWHVVKAYWYRLLDYTFKCLTIFMPALVAGIQQTGLASDMEKQIIVLAATTITSATGVFANWHDKRILYRNTAELLKEETIFYITNSDKYKTSKRNDIFVSEIHKIVYNTNVNWEKLENKKWEKEEEKQNKDK